jgi:hypothetical protein
MPYLHRRMCCTGEIVVCAIISTWKVIYKKPFLQANIVHRRNMMPGFVLLQFCPTISGLVEYRSPSMFYALPSKPWGQGAQVHRPMSRSTSPGPEVQGQVQKSKSNKFSSAGRDEVQKSKSPEVQIPGLQRSRSPSPIKISSAGRGEVQIPEVQKSKFPGPKVQKVWTVPPLIRC